MAEQNKPFVVTDRRRHTLDGELRPDADPSPERETAQVAGPVLTEEPKAQVEAVPEDAEERDSGERDSEEGGALGGPSAEQLSEARMAYAQTADRLTTAIRAANPGMEHPPAMTFDGVVQSVYMTAIMQLGGATPEGQQPQVDLMGAQQSIEMLEILKAKTAGNATVAETTLMDRALFELQMAFLEITQALARSAAAKQQGQGPGFGAPGGRPSIVR